MRNDRERIFPLGIRCDIEAILDDISESENCGNPVMVQVDNFPISDGEVDQPVYEAPQTQRHGKKLMKANILMDQMFNINHMPNSEVVEHPESLRDLILEFWCQQVFTVYMVCHDLAEARTCSINC